MKVCKYCFEPLEQNEGESDMNFRRREHCDRICASKHREEKKRGK